MTAFDTLTGIPGFDPRGDGLGKLELVEIDTPDGVFRFGIGFDGRFVDHIGREWHGLQILRVSSLGSAINGVAPEGEMSLSFFQDPDAPDLVAQVQALGADYIAGREIRFLFQPIRSPEELYAPGLPPVLHTTRIMRTVTARASGAQDRTLTLTFEAWSEKRRAARRIRFDRAGHEQLLGASNPSLEWRPTDLREDEKLFG